MVTTSATQTYTWSEFLNRDKQDVRKVTGNLEGESKVLNEGDQSLFDKDAQELGKQDFLNLLVTQLKYQDPLEPKADTEFVAQLAQFSNLETSQSMESSISGLSKSMTEFMETQKQLSIYASNTSAIGMLGKNVVMSQPEIQYSGATSTPFTVDVKTAGRHVVQIKDKDGEVVASLGLELDKAGEGKVEWDGLTTDGKRASGGTYSVEVVDAKSGAISGYTLVRDIVNGISYGSNGLVVKTESGDFNMSNLVSVEN